MLKAIQLLLALYTNELKNWEYAKEAPSIFASLSGAEAAKLKKFSDAGGRKLSGCPTPAETKFSGHLCIYTNELKNWEYAKEAPSIFASLSEVCTLENSGDSYTPESFGYIFDEYPPLYYPASMHALAGVSALGDSLELEDGSIWKICHYDGNKALNWRSNDPLTITQNHRWFSNYKYRIVNKNTGGCIEANLFLGPFEHGQHTLYITGIDREMRDLFITNSHGETTRWEISSGDFAPFQHWAIHDAVIVGQNSGWDTNCEALLINVNMNNCARARQN